MSVAPSVHKRGGVRLAAAAFVLVMALLLPNASAHAGAGTLDPSFGTGGTTYTPIDYRWSGALKLLDDELGRIYAGGFTYSGAALARYLGDGTLDPTFGTDGVVVDDRIGLYALTYFTRAPSGDLYAVGSVGDGGAAAVAHYDADGRVDDAFGVDGLAKVSMNSLWALETAPDGSLIAAGDCCDVFSCRVTIARVLPDGAVDHAFSPADSCRYGATVGTFQPGLPR